MHRFVFNLDNFTPERILYTDTARGASDKVWQQRNPKKSVPTSRPCFFVECLFLQFSGFLKAHTSI